jgi:hypothetical protein
VKVNVCVGVRVTVGVKVAVNVAVAVLVGVLVKVAVGVGVGGGKMASQADASGASKRKTRNNRKRCILQLQSERVFWGDYISSSGGGLKKGHGLFGIVP